MSKKQFNPIYENVICCDCGKTHHWDEQDCEIYRDDFLCKDCFESKYGYCNECGELNKYTDMSADILCGGCNDKAV